MDRRSFFRGLAAGTAGALAPMALASTDPAPPRFGYMTADRWRLEGHHAAGRRVRLDGEDVTDRCCWFNDATGEVSLRRERLVPGQPPLYIQRGVIEVVDAR